MNRNIFDRIINSIYDKYFLIKLDSREKKILHDSFLTNMKNNIKEELCDLVFETLVHEYHFFITLDVCKNDINRSDRIKRFNDYYSDEKNINQLLNKYIVLAQLIEQKSEDVINYVMEIINNYIDDLDQISIRFDNNFGKIKSVKLSLGDVHFGKSVALINFENGRLIYKPQALYCNLLLEELVNLFSNLSIRFPKNYVKENYTYQEYIDFHFCDNIEQVHTYYEKVGIYLAYFYILGSSDLHYENLIACKDNPMFIDLETLINGEITDINQVQHYKNIQSSVLNTALLPLIDDSSIFDINLSGIFTGENKSNTITYDQLVEDEKFDFVYVKKSFKVKGLKNDAQLENYSIDSDKAKNYLIKGFKETIYSIKDNKDNVLSVLKKYSTDNVAFRQLLRPTRVYACFLDASHNPEIMQDFEKYDDIFDILIDGFDARTFGYLRVFKEVELLKKGYIPSFHIRLNSRNIYSGDDVVCKNYFHKSPFESIKDKISNLNENMIFYQICLIEYSFLSLKKPVDIFNVENVNVKNCKLSNIETKNIVDEYLNRVQKMTIPMRLDEYSMPILNISDDKIRLLLLNPGIYNSGGIVMLYLAYYVCFRDKEKLDIAKRLLKFLSNQFELTIVNKNKVIDCSVFNGAGGLIYLYYNLFKVTNERYYLERTKRIIDIIFDNRVYLFIKNKNDISYLTGIGSLIILLKNINKDGEIDCSNYLSDISSEFEKIYFDNVSIIYKDGFAHGKLGVASILLVINSEKNDTHLQDCAINLIKSVNVSDYKWCNGILGAITCLLIAIKYNRDERIKNMLNDLINRITMEKLFEIKDLCLCHGIYGNIDVLLSLNREYDSKIHIEECYRNYFGDFESINWFKNYTTELNSFMLGASGVAYEILRLFNIHIPSVLMLNLF